MKLHQANAIPDWLQIAPAQRTAWQRLATRTNGIITPGNTISVTGLSIVIIGLGYITAQHQYIGLVLIGVGRFTDVIDGMVAERTKTKSHLGEAVDATADKIGLFLALLILMLQHMLPLIFVVVMGLQAVGMTVLGLTARMRHTELHPSREGKVATAVFWVTLLIFIMVTMLREHHEWHIAGIMDWSGYVLMGIAFMLGVYAFIMSIVITQ